ncbi:MAG: NAD-dependent epimerase/dehydratase family protein [Thermodesulfobacteriota bacterium]
MTESHILITGGAGFIGSHLADLLLDQGARVRVIDNFSTGQMANLPTTNPRLEVIDGDVEDSSLVCRNMQAITDVVHLAAVASVQASVDNPAATHGSNFVSTLNLLEECRRNNVKRFVFASSAAVYGNNPALPLTEDEAPAPLTPYAVDKLAGEQYIDFYSRQYGLEPVVFRFFNVFGPRQNPNSPYSGVISIFNSCFHNENEINIFGDGEQTRDFIYVTDLVKILHSGLTASKVPDGPVNISTSVSISLNQVIDAFSKISNRSLPVNHHPARPGDIRDSLGDNSRMIQWQDGCHFTPFEDGLRLLYNSPI